jgi:hypothetical protein
MAPKKKEVFNPFKTKAVARNVDPPDDMLVEEMRPGEFRDTSLTFTPAIPKLEAAMTLRFRCTARIVRGDSILIRLPGFRGQASVFQLEARPHPENRVFVENFQAYWTGEEQPKGGAPNQCLMLQCRKAVEENALIVLGIPEAAMIQLPEKLGANSPKLKIEGTISHADGGGKIPKASIMECTEVKKRPVEEEIAELDGLVKSFTASGLSEEDMEIAQSISAQELDQVWEAARQRSDLEIGLQWKLASGLFRNYEENAPLAKTVTELCHTLSKKRVPLALHKEIAANLNVKLAVIIALEDALVGVHGSYYPELTRSGILVMRLFTMEANDLLRLLGLTQNSVCIYREILSAMRTINMEGLTKWTSFIAAMMTITSKLTHIDTSLIPPLYRGMKDVPQEQLQHLYSLKKDDWYLFPTFTTLTASAHYLDEGYTCPDNAVLFEVRNCAEGLEIGDGSHFPEDREWLLPMFSSFSVISIDVVAEKNHLVRVVLKMKGSLAGAARDEVFPETDRSLASVVVKKIRSDAEAMGLRSHQIAKAIYARIKLQDRKAQSPQFLLHCQYLAQFADTKRQSVAKQSVEEGLVKWQQCTAEASIGGDGVMRPATWETINKRQATTVELFFLKRTREQKQWEGDGVKVSFTDFTVDLGKGVKKTRRMLGKFVSHPFLLTAPPPAAT